MPPLGQKWGKKRKSLPRRNASGKGGGGEVDGALWGKNERTKTVWKRKRGEEPWEGKKGGGKIVQRVNQRERKEGGRVGQG